MKSILFNVLNEYGIALPEDYSVADIDQLTSDAFVGSAHVLLREDTIIGFVLTRPIDYESIELKRLYLIASERRKGLGKLLLKRALVYAQNASYRLMRLETTSRFKEAVAFYQKAGFIELAGIPTAAGHDLVFEKAI